MAIDTKRKRASALHFRRGGIGVVPDSSIDRRDRQVILHSYHGILATSTYTLPATLAFTSGRNNSSGIEIGRNNSSALAVSRNNSLELAILSEDGV